MTMATMTPEQVAQCDAFRGRLVGLVANCVQDGWDSYGANGLTKAAVSGLLGMFVAPTVNGGIQVSWENEQVQVEFDADGKVVSVLWDRSE